MMRAEKLIQIIKTAKLTGGVDDPPSWQIEKTRFQSNLCRILLLPVATFVCVRYVPETRGTDLSHLDELALAEAGT